MPEGLPGTDSHGAPRHLRWLSLRCLQAPVPRTRKVSDAAFDWTGIYAGVFVGAGQTDNRIVDIDGFANWGNPGSTLDYDDDGFVGGALVGRKFEVGGMPFRIEIDGTFGICQRIRTGSIPGLDETAATKFRWIATARGGIEQTLGPVTVFASGGVAAARIYNSVTDIDFGPNIPTHIDRDDSFRGSSTRIGWVIGLGVEAPLADAWMLRLEGIWISDGASTT